MRNIKFGWLSKFGLLFTSVGLVICALCAISAIFGFQLEIRGAPLPNDWYTIGMVFVAVALIGVLSVYGAFMATRFKAAKGKPLVRVCLVVVGLGLLVLAFRGIQVVALTGTYGSMLAYYATDGDLDDVKSELEGEPKQEHLDEAVSRAAQYNNVGALKLLLAAGATFNDTGAKEEHRRCALDGGRVDLEFIQVALAAGVTPDTCPNSQTLIYEKVRFGQGDDAEIAKIVTALRGAGWPAEVKPDHAKQTPLEVALKAKKPLTAAALR